MAKKRRKLKIGRIILAIILVVGICFGIYKGFSYVIKYVNSLFPQVEENIDNEVKEPDVEEKIYIGTVVIDPGHGGWDAGSNRGQLYEKDITLKISKAIAEEVEKSNIKAVLTRTDDTALADNKISDLQLRCDASAQNHAQYFVSIHVNDHEEVPEVSGFEIYTKDEDSQSLAQYVSQQIETLNYSTNRGIIDGNILAVLRDNTVPSILVEVGYIEGDYDYLSDDQKLEKYGQAIGKGIVEQFIKNKTNQENND